MGSFFLHLEVWMKNLSIFELNIGFNAKAHAYGQIPRSRILHPGQSVGIATV